MHALLRQGDGWAFGLLEKVFIIFPCYKDVDRTIKVTMLHDLSILHPILQGNVVFMVTSPYLLQLSMPRSEDIDFVVIKQNLPELQPRLHRLILVHQDVRVGVRIAHPFVITVTIGRIRRWMQVHGPAAVTTTLIIVVVIVVVVVIIVTILVVLDIVRVRGDGRAVAEGDTSGVIARGGPFHDLEALVRDAEVAELDVRPERDDIHELQG